MNKLAIFDCDGTLVDSQATICTAIAHSFANHGLPGPGRAASLDIIGLSVTEAMAKLHPHGTDEEHRSLGDGYKLAFQKLRADGLAQEPLYDGIGGVLDKLEADGWLLAVATGKSDRGLSLCLMGHGWLGRFVSLQTADRHPSKPHPSMIHHAMADAGASPETTVMIGDTSYDMLMARAAGCTAIGVAWGYHEAAELEAAGADVVVATAAELSAFLERLP
ncbi:HAD-IA family hydrolase [Sphingomonas naphthae]|uniref:HAD-IA family hydrolase n=1 Tax=Sphingomonas naphthae TaxID=1813468 RepID=A0ABY7THK6_9SPHN|nr:HAD-IA family hydrolase [Sphingomonas naphthae]WCT71920.1 HAD-IA family hydrolase [Sphingomonas naphthae]